MRVLIFSPLSQCRPPTYPIRKHGNLSRLADTGYVPEAFLGKLSYSQLPALKFGLHDCHKLVDLEGTDNQ